MDDMGAGEKSLREEYAETTRRVLLAKAKRLFASRGYEATGIEDVCRAARVTRGALYHHFKDKRALFDALVVHLQDEADHFVLERVRDIPDPVKRLERGIDAYLEACGDPAFRRLVIQEGATVLGATRFRETEMRENQRLLMAPFAAMKREGLLDFDDIELFSWLVGRVIWEAAILVPESANPKRTRKLALEFVHRLLAAFQPR
jgi:AcrR family transcriptional regulator